MLHYAQEQLQGDYYTRAFQGKAQEDTLILNMGPQHPSTHGVLRIILELHGEYILRAEPVLGYVHRMQEKMGEVKTYPQYIANMGRVDYLHALAWNWAYVKAVEELLELEVPERAEYIRVITCELNRITSHLLWWGAYLLDLGAFTPIMYGFADRERAMDLFQVITGSRLTYCYYTFGGVIADFTPELITGIEDFCKYMRTRLPMYKDLVTDNMILRQRVDDIGAISPDMARRYGATGPVLRGSGIEHDLRRNTPYSIYDRFDFDIPAYEECDALARYMVRMDEMEESLKIVEQALKTLPDGPIMPAKMPKTIKPPKGEAYGAVEGARGVIGVHVISDGTANPYRIKLRSPSYCNLSLFEELSRGILLADAVSILGSLDLVIPEIDR